MNKDRQIVSELRNFFTGNGCGLGIQRIMNVLGTINITERQMAFEKKRNCKFTCTQVIQMMILFPFFSIKNVANYIGSSLYPLFDCHKDMFYRVLSNDRIDWRHILRYVNKKLAASITVRSDAEAINVLTTATICDSLLLTEYGWSGEDIDSSAFDRDENSVISRTIDEFESLVPLWLTRHIVYDISVTEYER